MKIVTAFDDHAHSDDRNAGKGRIRNAALWRPLNLSLLTERHSSATASGQVPSPAAGAMTAHRPLLSVIA